MGKIDLVISNLEKNLLPEPMSTHKIFSIALKFS